MPEKEVIQLTPVVFAAWSGFLTLGGAILGWLVNRMFKMMDDLRQEDATLHERITRLHEETSDKYVRRDDFRDFAKQVLDAMGRIETKLDNKADK